MQAQRNHKHSQRNTSAAQRDILLFSQSTRFSSSNSWKLAVVDLETVLLLLQFSSGRRQTDWETSQTVAIKAAIKTAKISADIYPDDRRRFSRSHQSSDDRFTRWQWRVVVAPRAYTDGDAQRVCIMSSHGRCACAKWTEIVAAINLRRVRRTAQIEFTPSIRSRPRAGDDHIRKFWPISAAMH